MSASYVNTTVEIIVGIVAIIGAIIAVVRAVWTYQKNQREARMLKVQNRVEYLKDQMNTLLKTLADIEGTTRTGGPHNLRGEVASAVGLAQGVMFSVGHTDLDNIGSRLNPSVTAASHNSSIIAEGIKRLARIIHDESMK